MRPLNLKNAVLDASWHQLDAPRPFDTTPGNHFAAHVGSKIIEKIYNKTIAKSNNAFRVIETSHPPTYYFPPKDVDMNLFWDGESQYRKNRFRKVCCTAEGCKTQSVRVDKWLRRPHEVDNTIRAWLMHNNVLKEEARPAKKTRETNLVFIPSSDN